MEDYILTLSLMFMLGLALLVSFSAYETLGKMEDINLQKTLVKTDVLQPQNKGNLS